MKPSADGVIRQIWPQDVSDRPAASVTKHAADTPAPSSDEEALFEARLDAWEARIEEAVDEDVEDGGDGVLTAASVAPWIAANLMAVIDREIAGVLVKTRVEMGVLRRSLDSVTTSLAAARRKAVETRAALRSQITALEKQIVEDRTALADMRKAIAAVELGADRDRALRRHVAARQKYPHADRAALEAARRKTDRALGGVQ